MDLGWPCHLLFTTSASVFSLPHRFHPSFHQEAPSLVPLSVFLKNSLTVLDGKGGSSLDARDPLERLQPGPAMPPCFTQGSFLSLSEESGRLSLTAHVASVYFKQTLSESNTDPSSLLWFSNQGWGWGGWKGGVEGR